jgi:GNAT superfamily N-acetyltransferase
MRPDGPESVGPVHDRPGFIFPLRDGRPVFLSPILPEDRTRLEAGYEQLSERSRFFRFFREHDRLTEEELRLYTEVDQVRHVAWCALDQPDPPYDGLATGRWIRLPDDPTTAEVAVTVIDVSQRLGLGSILLALLVLRARMLGVERFRAFVLPENEAVVRWLEGLGWVVVRRELFLEFEAPTGPDAPRSGPETPTRRRFDRLLDDLRGPLLRCLDAMEGRGPGELTEPSHPDPADNHGPTASDRADHWDGGTPP